jgi:hypothetical protein
MESEGSIPLTLTNFTQRKLGRWFESKSAKEKGFYLVNGNALDKNFEVPVSNLSLITGYHDLVKGFRGFPFCSGTSFVSTSHKLCSWKIVINEPKNQPTHAQKLKFLSATWNKQILSVLAYFPYFEKIK